jgi:hypothetical protein
VGPCISLVTSGCHCLPIVFGGDGLFCAHDQRATGQPDLHDVGIGRLHVLLQLLCLGSPGVAKLIFVAQCGVAAGRQRQERSEGRGDNLGSHCDHRFPSISISLAMTLCFVPVVSAGLARAGN